MYKMTYEELLNNYEFKVTKRILKKEYPWIRDVVKVEPEELDTYKNLIFLDIIIDEDKLAQMENLKLTNLMRDILSRDYFRSILLSTFYSGDRDAMDRLKNIKEDMERTMESVHKSPAIPKDLKLPQARELAVGSFYAGKNIPTHLWQPTSDSSS